MDVAEWLRGLGLGEYSAAFDAERIDLEAVPTLSDQDLKEIGVLPLGHRRKILAAAAALDSPKVQPPPPVAPPAAASPRRTFDEAERRPITVMFCDLVGSTAIAAKLDAEDWRDLVNGYLDEAFKAVSGYGGHVLKKLGDGLMALFGYPRAQENDAERAARAALAILRALDDLNARNLRHGLPSLAARIGLESGPVIVDGTGEVFGDAPNVAARVQSAAEPGTLLVTAAVQRQIAGLFVAEDRGPHELKGVVGKPVLYRLVRASGGGRRIGARSLTPFVGREEELALIWRRWERASDGEGQFVQIVGEPGLGKSRLMEEFRTRLAETPHTWTGWTSSQLLQNTPLHPLSEWGRQRFGSADTPERRLAELESTLAQVRLEPAEQAPLLAPLLDIPMPEGRKPNLAPEELRRKQLAAVVAWILAGARTQQIVLAFEDLHWADPTTLDLMKTLAERGAMAPLFVLATARPEFRTPWAIRSHHATVSLGPLDRAQIRRMVGSIAEQRALTKEVVEGVTDRTGGVPLFIEEVTRLMLEGGGGTIPPTLQQSLAARLDRLGEAREIAQIGAVLGREFSYPLLKAVAKLGESALQGSLDRLVDADLMFIEGTPPEANYRFKHALIQDAAYDSLLRSRRRALHLRAAEVLCDTPDRAAAEPELVAYHFTEAGIDHASIEWWGKAGDQALRRSAFREAIAHLRKAIDRSNETTGISSQKQRLHVAYGNALLQARGYGAPETAEAFANARALAGDDTDTLELLSADYGLWTGSFVRGELASMRKHAETFLGDVAARPDSPEAGVAHRAVGNTHWFAGEYRQALDHLNCALALFRPDRDDDLAFRFGHDAGVRAMLYLALTLWPLGDVNRAMSLARDAEARSVVLDHIGTRAQGGVHSGLFALMRGDMSQIALNASQLSRVAREHELPFWEAFTFFLEGAASAENSGLENMRRGVNLLKENKILMFDGLLKIALARAEAHAGNVGNALTILTQALATCERTGHRTFEAELHRTRGEMLLTRDPTSSMAAEQAFQSAIAVAQRQESRSFGLRAALSLAKLYLLNGRAAEANDVLAPALQGFSPNLEMAEIAEAHALLATVDEERSSE